MFVTLCRTIRFTPDACAVAFGAATAPPSSSTIAARPRTDSRPRNSSSTSSQNDRASSSRRSASPDQLYRASVSLMRSRATSSQSCMTGTVNLGAPPPEGQGDYGRAMTTRDSREVVIEATPQEILDVIADVESTPTWSPQYQRSEVLEACDDGRPKRVK